MPCKAAKKSKHIKKKIFLKERNLIDIIWNKKTARILTPMSS